MNPLFSYAGLCEVEDPGKPAQGASDDALGNLSTDAYARSTNDVLFFYNQNNASSRYLVALLDTTATSEDARVTKVLSEPGAGGGGRGASQDTSAATYFREPKLSVPDILGDSIGIAATPSQGELMILANAAAGANFAPCDETNVSCVGAAVHSVAGSLMLGLGGMETWTTIMERGSALDQMIPSSAVSSRRSWRKRMLKLGALMEDDVWPVLRLWRIAQNLGTPWRMEPLPEGEVNGSKALIPVAHRLQQQLLPLHVSRPLMRRDSVKEPPSTLPSSRSPRRGGALEVKEGEEGQREGTEGNGRSAHRRSLTGGSMRTLRTRSVSVASTAGTGTSSRFSRSQLRRTGAEVSIPRWWTLWCRRYRTVKESLILSTLQLDLDLPSKSAAPCPSTINAPTPSLFLEDVKGILKGCSDEDVSVWCACVCAIADVGLWKKVDSDQREGAATDTKAYEQWQRSLPSCPPVLLNLLSKTIADPNRVTKEGSMTERAAFWHMQRRHMYGIVLKHMVAASGVTRVGAGGDSPAAVWYQPAVAATLRDQQSSGGAQDEKHAELDAMGRTMSELSSLRLSVREDESYADSSDSRSGSYPSGVDVMHGQEPAQEVQTLLYLDQRMVLDCLPK